MKEIFKKITLWFILSILTCVMIYLISSIVHASFDFRHWSVIGRFFTGLMMVITIWVIADEVSGLYLKE